MSLALVPASRADDATAFENLAAKMGLTLPDLENVFGKDDRVAMYGSAKPWSAVGKLVFRAGVCTATLVGPNVAVTAAHCFYDVWGNGPAEAFFLPNFKSNKSKAFASVVELRVGTTRPYSEDEKDWAVVRLSESLGDVYGFIPVDELGTRDVYKRTWGSITLAGYSGDFKEGRTAGVQEGCSIRGYDEGYYLHDCDSTKGSSGAAMILWTKSKGHRVVGVNVGARYLPGTRQDPPHGIAYSDDVANLAVPSMRFAATVRELSAKGTR